jgi:hypothetical protein
LLVEPSSSELVQMPVADPSSSRLLRAAKLELGPDGTLRGDVEETRTGALATFIRSRMLRSPLADRSKVLEGFLSSFLTSFQLTKAAVGNLDDPDADLILHYSFEAPNYAKSAGPLLLLRSRVLGEKSSDIMEKPRHYSVDFGYVATEVDNIEIRLPDGYVVDELPRPTKAQFAFAEYFSQIQQSSRTVRYNRQFRVKQLSVDTPGFEDLKRLYRQIASDEDANVVLKRTGTDTR